MLSIHEAPPGVYDITILAYFFDDIMILNDYFYDITISTEKIDDITILAKQFRYDDIRLFTQSHDMGHDMIIKVTPAPIIPSISPSQNFCLRRYKSMIQLWISNEGANRNKPSLFHFDISWVLRGLGRFGTYDRGFLISLLCLVIPLIFPMQCIIHDTLLFISYHGSYHGVA